MKKKLVIIALLVMVGLVTWFTLRGQNKGEQLMMDHSDLARRSNTRITDNNNANSKIEVSAYDTSQSLSKASSIEKKHIEPLESIDISSKGDELATIIEDDVLDDVSKQIRHVENRGGFLSRAAQVHWSVQETFLKSEEYKNGKKLISIAKKQKEDGEFEQSDKNYRLAIYHYLKAASQHLDADISGCIFFCGWFLRDKVSQPDYEAAYMLVKYSLVINPRGNRAKIANAFAREFEEKHLLSQEKMQELDNRIGEIKSLEEFLKDEYILPFSQYPNNVNLEKKLQ